MPVHIGPLETVLLCIFCGPALIGLAALAYVLTRKKKPDNDKDQIPPS